MRGRGGNYIVREGESGEGMINGDAEKRKIGKREVRCGGK